MFSVKTLVACNDRYVSDLKNFLKYHGSVKVVHSVNDMNGVFCNLFNLFIETEHESERAYVAFKKGIMEIYRIERVADFQVSHL